MSLLFSVGFPTGMEGLTYPIPFSIRRTWSNRQARRSAGLPFGVGQRPHDHPALRACRVPGAAAFLGAAGHLFVPGRPYEQLGSVPAYSCCPCGGTSW